LGRGKPIRRFSAFRRAGPVSDRDERVVWIASDDDGLGVRSELFRGNNQVDGDGTDEVLTLTFDQQVRLVSVTFNSTGSRDDVIISDAGGVIYDDTPWPPSDGSVVNLSNGSWGHEISFLAAERNDDFYVAAVEVEAVPEPGTVALFGLGLAGAVVAARRRRRRVARS